MAENCALTGLGRVIPVWVSFSSGPNMSDRMTEPVEEECQESARMGLPCSGHCPRPMQVPTWGIGDHQRID